MPLKQEDTLRDVLIVAIGTAGVNIVRSAKEILGTRYQLKDKYCRVHYLLVDTDTIPESPDNHEYEQTYQVRLADKKGRENGQAYKEKIIVPRLKDLQAQGIVPDYVTADLLDHELLNRMETGEANKNPIKGYLYLLANLRRFYKQIASIKSKMIARDRSIYILYSPISGTAAGTWFLITSLIFQEFETSSPILINLMPSGLEGDEEHKNRNYAIYGWSARLLEVLVRDGVTQRWVIPQLTNPPIELTVRKREPLYTLVQSAYRNQGDMHLTDSEFFQVTAEMLCLAVIGKQDGQGPSSIDSQITNTETDQRMDELKAPDIPTRRFASRGYCAVRYNAKLAKEVTRLGVKDAVLRYLIPSLPLYSQPNQSDPASLAQPLSQNTLDEAREHLMDYFGRQVQTFYREWNNRAIKRVPGEAPSLSEIDTAIDGLQGAFSQDLTDIIKNLREDGADEAPIRQPLWEVIQKLLGYYGFGLFRHLENTLDSIRIDDAFILQQIFELSEKYKKIDEAIIDAQARADQHRTRIAIKGKDLDSKALERSFKIIIKENYNKAIRETLKGDYKELLNNAIIYFVIELQHIRQRLENINEENSRDYALHLSKLDFPISKYLDERSYALAKEKVEKYRRDLGLIVRELFQGIDYKLDRKHLGQEQLSNRLDAVIMNQEGIDEFPKDIVGVVRRVASNQNLLIQLLSRGRALTKLRSTGYERNWCIWYSGTKTPALTEALDSLKESINDVLSDEAFKIIINDGPLPLRSENDIEMVLAETILDFPLSDIETDKSMQEYWNQDEAMFSNGDATSVHRVHTAIVSTAQTRQRRTARVAPSTIRQEDVGARQRGRFEALPRIDESAVVNSSDELSDEDIAVVADRLGIDAEEIKSKLKALDK